MFLGYFWYANEPKTETQLNAQDWLTFSGKIFNLKGYLSRDVNEMTIKRRKAHKAEIGCKVTQYAKSI